MNINPGELNKRISFYFKPTAKDADGYPSGEPTLFYSCYAKATRTSGTELIKANADMSSVAMRFLIRYTTNAITRNMIIKYNSDDYEITYINDYGDGHQYVEIIADRIGL